MSILSGCEKAEILPNVCTTGTTTTRHSELILQPVFLAVGQQFSNRRPRRC